jgi:hypothetical protein
MTGKRTVVELARGYLKHHRTRAAEDSWAFDEVRERVGLGAADPEDAWNVVLALVTMADDESLGYIGAGPLEQLVRRFGSALVERIEDRARQDPRFRFCLGSVWLSEGDLPLAVQDRVVSASGGRIKPMASPSDGSTRIGE